MAHYPRNNYNNSMNQRQRRKQGPGMKLWRSLSGKTEETHTKGAPVGTQAKALENISNNSKNFGYPPEGFVTPIEHSLLYSMIDEPKIYPQHVVLEHIAQEDFNTYLPINDDKQSQKEGKEEEEPRVSYKQLSALLTLSALKFPSAQQQQQTQTNKDEEDNENSISKALCKKIMRCVIQYAEAHDLDRKAELHELLQPVERYAATKQGNTLVPMYIAYAVGLVIPGGVGLGITMLSLSAILASSDQVDRETQNVHTMANESNRVGDVEKTGLLDEAEDDYY